MACGLQSRAYLAKYSESARPAGRTNSDFVRPLAVITGTLLGSCLAITVSLAAVILIFLILGSDYPRLSYEFRGLATSLPIFLVMTTISALSFYCVLIGHRSRRFALTSMWIGFIITAWFYWP